MDPQTHRHVINSPSPTLLAPGVYTCLRRLSFLYSERNVSKQLRPRSSEFLFHFASSPTLNLGSSGLAAVILTFDTRQLFSPFYLRTTYYQAELRSSKKSGRTPSTWELWSRQTNRLVSGCQMYFVVHHFLEITYCIYGVGALLSILLTFLSCFESLY